MGCCVSSPYSSRRYHDPADLEEEVVPLRYFGNFQVGSNLIPDDITGLPSAHLRQHLATQSNTLLYEAEIDHGKACRCLRLNAVCALTPCGLVWLSFQSILSLCSICTCDEACCWVRKEYSTRTYFRIYPNRIEVNEPRVRFPYGYLGCGSWNSDNIVAHPFDRGAFGFSHVRCLVVDYLCCIWPIYGGVVARHRCQCNGGIWNRMFTDCGGWWCDEWLCKSCFCTYRYRGLAYPDEVAFAASIALQAYFEGRAMTPDNLEQCISFWKDNIAQRTDPLGRKRHVCCEPYYVPIPTMRLCYLCTHPIRRIPYKGDEITDDLTEVYEKYTEQRANQIHNYEYFAGQVHTSTLCRAFGCRRFFGRQGVVFCTDGCTSLNRNAGEPAPPFSEHDFDDDWDASTVLIHVMGPPPPNVVIRRWRWDPEIGENFLETYPETVPVKGIEAKGKDN